MIRKITTCALICIIIMVFVSCGNDNDISTTKVDKVETVFTMTDSLETTNIDETSNESITTNTETSVLVTLITSQMQTDISTKIETAIETSSEEKLVVESLTSPINAGQTATISVRGTPNIEYSIKVKYKSGYSSAQGLEKKYSDDTGFVSWTWDVGAKTTPGTWSIEISGGGEKIVVDFVIT